MLDAITTTNNKGIMRVELIGLIMQIGGRLKKTRDTFGRMLGYSLAEMMNNLLEVAGDHAVSPEKGQKTLGKFIELYCLDEPKKRERFKEYFKSEWS